MDGTLFVFVFFLSFESVQKHTVLFKKRREEKRRERVPSGLTGQSIESER
jgi:hypothetical protein